MYFDYQAELGPSKMPDDHRSYNPDAQPSGPAWLRRIIGEEYFREVVGVDLSGLAISQVDFEQLTKLPAINDLNLNKTTILLTGPVVERRINDDDARIIGSLKKLRVLSLHEANIDAAGVARLVPLKHLFWLNLSDSAIDDSAMREISKMSNLYILILSGTHITDAGLKQLSGLTNLTEWLSLANTSISDAGLEHLKPLINLKNIILQDTQVTPEGVRGLQKSLPKAGISLRQ